MFVERTTKTEALLPGIPVITTFFHSKLWQLKEIGIQAGVTSSDVRLTNKLFFLSFEEERVNSICKRR